MAASPAFQLGARLVRRRARRRRARRAAGLEDSRRRRRGLQLRRTLRRVQPGRQRPARARGEARRPALVDARQCRAAVGVDARGDQARTRRHSRHHDACGRRHRGPALAGPGALRDCGRGGRAQVRGAGGRRDADRAGRRAAGLARIFRAAEGLRRLQPGRADAGRRSDAALLHVRHHRAAQARAAQPCELSDRPSLDHVRARA